MNQNHKGEGQSSQLNQKLSGYWYFWAFQYNHLPQRNEIWVWSYKKNIVAMARWFILDVSSPLNICFQKCFFFLDIKNKTVKIKHLTYRSVIKISMLSFSKKKNRIFFLWIFKVILKKNIYFAVSMFRKKFHLNKIG